MRVPGPLVPRFGLLEFKGSLRTDNPVLARNKCRKLSAQLELLVTRARHMPALKQEELKKLAREYFAAAVMARNEHSAGLLP